MKGIVPVTPFNSHSKHVTTINLYKKQALRIDSFQVGVGTRYQNLWPARGSAGSGPMCLETAVLRYSSPVSGLLDQNQAPAVPDTAGEFVASAWRAQLGVILIDEDQYPEQRHIETECRLLAVPELRLPH